LGKLLKIKNPTLYKLQTKFSEQFDPIFNYKVNNNQVEIVQITATSPELDQMVKDLDGKIPSPDLVNRLRSNNSDISTKVGYGIHFGCPITIKPISRGNEWEFDFEDEYNRPRTFSILRTRNTLAFYLDLNKEYHPLKSDGDLALDTYSLVYLMEEVIGANEVNADFTAYGLASDALKNINATFAGKTKPFVVATINGFNEWSTAKGDSTRRTFDAPPVLEPPPAGQIRPLFQHIIGVTGPITGAGAYYEVPVWTWATEFTVKIRKELLPQYIYGYVYGEL
jgi:hypothetical protein